MNERKIRIYFLLGGFVIIGKVLDSGGPMDSDGKNHPVKLDLAHCIRDWGTSSGIKEIAEGPTGSTKLDLYPLDSNSLREFFTVPFHAIVHTMDVGQDWLPVLEASAQKGV